VSRQPVLKLRLYVAGDADNSAQAISNLHSICQSRLAGCHEIEVVDVFREPKRALSDGILMTPTLLKISPAPVRRVIGTLSQPEILLRALGLEQHCA